MQRSGTICPVCQAGDLQTFYQVAQVPVHSVRLMPTRRAARELPRGDIELAFCGGCGFITNRRFDATLVEYESDYEETQGFSGTFRAFHRRLAETLVDRYDLQGKRVVEIGCGKGEFLHVLCEIGDVEGLGFDPSFIESRIRPPSRGRMQVRAELFSADAEVARADLICCKMTLEHCVAPRRFLAEIRAGLPDTSGPAVFFQVPDASRILHRGAFWDVYYEHCSYFTADSLAVLFEATGFDVVDVWADYDDQYLMIDARPSASSPSAKRRSPANERMEALVATFVEAQAKSLRRWNDAIDRRHEACKTTVLWGGGSKAVSFLSALRSPDFVDAVVDVNPHRQGTFLPGVAHEIVPPARLREAPPDTVIVMNPIYREEIRRDLDRLGVKPEVLTLEA